MKKLLFSAAVLFFALSESLFAGYYGTDDFCFVTNLTMLGVNQAAGYKGVSMLEDRDTIFWLFGGAKVNHRGFYRDAYDENCDLYDDSYDDFKYWAGNITWGAGVSQGLVDDSRKKTDLLYASIFYKGMREWYEEDSSKYLSQTSRSDRSGLLQNSVIFELAFDDVLVDDVTGTKSGVFANATFEYAPRFFFNECCGESDFRKYYATLKIFVPVHEFLDRSPFSTVYFGNSMSADYVTGDEVSLYARQHFGSITSFDGLGGLVRGYESNRFDSRLKFANRSELRLLMKKIPVTSILDRDVFIRFSAITFLDMGCYALLDGSDDGFLCSCGIGALASLMDILSVSGYLACPLSKKRLDRKALVPVLGFGFKF